MQEQEDTEPAENARLKTREREKMFYEVMVAIAKSLNGIAISDDGENRDDADDEVTEQGQLSNNDEPGWVMGTITNTVQQRMERFRQKEMKLDELTQPGWEDAANLFPESDKKYGPPELTVAAVVEPQTNDDTTATSPTTFGELMKCLDIVLGISQMMRVNGPSSILGLASWIIKGLCHDISP